MTILKFALLGSLRIIIFGSLKVGLFVYALFLSDTSFTGSVPEDTGHVGESVSSAASGSSSQAKTEQAISNAVSLLG